MFLLVFLFSYSFFYFFSKKLIVLLMLESLMLSSILLFSLFFMNSLGCSFFLFVLTLFMVLESVFGISILVGCGRNSTNFNSFFNFL